MSAIRFDVGADQDGQRVDIVVVRWLPESSRAAARELCENGLVRVNGHRVRKGHRVRAGDHVEVSAPPSPRDFDPQPNERLDVVVLFESPHVVVCNKPARMPCHPLRAAEDHTLANFLAHRFSEMLGVGRSRRELGLIHRIDTNTTGVVVAARDSATYQYLRMALANHEIDKRYQALCVGQVVAPRIIDYPLESRGKRMVPARGFASARSAETEVLKATPIGRGFSFVEVRARRATRHQVRAHLSAIGNPLVGDELYDGPPSELGHHFLHASSVRFRPAPKAEWQTVTAPLFAEHRQLMQRLEEI